MCCKGHWDCGCAEGRGGWRGQRVTVCCSVSQCFAVFCGGLQLVAIGCSVFQWVTVIRVAVDYNVLQWVAVGCSGLQWGW